MEERTIQSLLSLICEDRAEIRMKRSSISSYSATFLSVIIAALAASRGKDAIIDDIQASWLSVGFLLIYIAVASVHAHGLRSTRVALNRREALMLGTDDSNEGAYSEERIRVLYANPDQYKKAVHAKQHMGDIYYYWMVVATGILSIIAILIAQQMG